MIIKTYKLIALNAFFCLGLISCWQPCAPGISGSILDFTTGIPLDSVQIELYENESLIETSYTDSLGTFYTGLNSTPFFFISKCKRDYSLRLTKTDYDQANHIGTAPDVGIKVYMKK